MVESGKSTVAEYLQLDDAALLAQCDVDHYRSHGPGGQKRNKTSSAVRLRHRPTGLAVTATEDRSQHVNKARAIRRLRESIALNRRTLVDPEGYVPGEVVASCIGGDRSLSVGRRDARYNHVMREVLDLVAACEARVSRVAECVDVSTAHLVKFFRKDPKLWKQVNQMRAAAGLKALR